MYKNKSNGFQIKQKTKIMEIKNLIMNVLNVEQIWQGNKQTRQFG